MQDESIQAFNMIGIDINAIREAVVALQFKNNIGRRALLLIPSFPFLIVGTIEDVVGDYIVIKAEITNVTELDGEVFRVHTDDIEVFYVEDEGRKIPDIRAGHHA